MRENYTIKMPGFAGFRLVMMLLFLSLAMIAKGQNTVSGRVVDEETGEGLPGVTVQIKGTTQGAITDIDGNFRLQASSDDILLVSYVGFVPQEFPVGSTTNFSVILAPDIDVLDEVVVVGFGEQQKASVVGSITTADGEDLVKAGGVVTLSEGLAGLMAGVTTQQNAGIPGSSQSRILIRGAATWNGTAPLILVDGIERDMNNIDPNEVESITVLKDASATAVYGSRAGNGAIIITTKSGSKGRVRVNYTANFGLKTPSINSDYIADFPETLRALNEALRNSRQFDQIRSESEIALWEDPNRNRDLYTYTRWANDMIGTGFAQSHNLNLSGGNDFVTFFTSFGYNYDGDIFNIDEQPEFDPRTFQNRYNFRQNMKFNLTKSTVVEARLSVINTNWNGNPTTNQNGGVGFADGGNALNRFFYTASLLPAQFSTGEFSREEGSSTPTNFRGFFERSGQIQKRATQTWTDFIINQDLSSVVEGLKIGAKVSYNNTVQRTQSLAYNELYFFPSANQNVNPETGEVEGLVLEPFVGNNFGGNAQPVQQPPTLQGDNQAVYNNRLYYEGSINYKRRFANIHDVSALALFYRQEDRLGATAFEQKRESWVGRLTYNYDERYYFEANGAYLGSDRFAPGNRFGFFPSVAVGWTLTNEPYLENITAGWLDYFKVRYSIGVVGVDGSFEPWSYRATFTEALGNDNPNNFNAAERFFVFFGDNFVPLGGRITESRVPNPNATWEESVKQNLGIETAFLDDRLKLTVDLFNERRQNINTELQNTISVFAGFLDDPFATIGETKNQGIDIELGWQNAVTPDFTYWVKGNVSLSESRVIRRDDPLGAPDYQKQAGKPIGIITGMLIDGYLDDWDDVYNSTQSAFASGDPLIPGDFQYIDFNGDGILDVNDRAPIGIDYQAVSYSVLGGVQLKGLSLNVNFTGVEGIVKNVSENYFWPWETNSNLGFQLNDTEIADFWRPDNPNAASPVLRTISVHNKEQNTYTVRDASFIKLRSAEIGYQIPVSKINFLRSFSQFQVYVNGNNLWVWTDFPEEIDPESRNLSVYPLARRYNVGVRIGF